MAKDTMSGASGLDALDHDGINVGSEEKAPYVDESDEIADDHLSYVQTTKPRIS